MRTYTQFDKVADREKILVVYPNAIDKSWNVAGADDIGFLLMLIDTIANRYAVDRNRIYSTGFYQGGFISHNLAAAHADKIAAIAPVSGLLSNQNIKPSRPVPVLHIHGSADDMVEYSGVASTISTWVKKNNCPQTPVKTDPYPATKADSKTTKDYYGPCDQNSEVVLLTMGGVGHAWATGGTKYDINVNEEIWAFFKNHTLKGTTGILSTAPHARQRVTARYERGFISIMATEKIGNVSCLDPAGRVFCRWSFDADTPRPGHVMLPITTKLPAGIYLLSFTGNLKTTTVPIVIP